MPPFIKLTEQLVITATCHRFYNTKAHRRLLSQVYSPFSALEEGSPEHETLAEAGRVWENYFNLGNIEPFQDMQVKLKKELEEIDDFKHIVSRDDKNRPYTTALSTEYAHQSATLEGNSLIIVQVNAISAKLAMKFDGFPEDTTPASNLLPNETTNEVAELRNRIIVCRKIFQAAVTTSNTRELDES